MSVEAHYLDNAFSAIVERHGAIDAYAEDVLLVTPDKLEKMEAYLLD